MRIVFFGSGAFAIPCFETLLDAGHHVAALVTQPDREKGRGRGLAPPPLKPVAERRGVPLLQPARIRDPESILALRALAPEVQVVVAYGQILSRAVIDVAPLGTVNVHASLLPKYRGAAPIQWAIANGETETGVTTMLIDEGLDTGPLLLARRVPIGGEETANDLSQRLARLGAELLLVTLEGLGNGALRGVPQDHSLATLAPALRKEHGRADWRLPASVLAARVRGFDPWPGVVASYGGRAVRLIQVRTDQDGPGQPGTVVALDREGIVVACGDCSRLRLLAVQPESRRVMPASAFAAGARLDPGARFD